MELRLGDAHGIEGVDVENVEAATSVHQHLGEALLMDDGVDDEQVATRSSVVEPPKITCFLRRSSSTRH